MQESREYWRDGGDVVGEELLREILDEIAAVHSNSNSNFNSNSNSNSKEAEEEDEREYFAAAAADEQLQVEAPCGRRRRESMVNKLISTVYSGPTISDIESSLSFSAAGDHQLLADGHNFAASSCSPV